MKLGTKLVVSLISTIVIIMLVHGYLSLRQDRENILREMRVGMVGLSRAVQAALRSIYGDAHDVKATKHFIDGVGRPGNIHALVIYDLAGAPIALSASLAPSEEFPDLDAKPVLDISPREVLRTGDESEGVVENAPYPIYYRIGPIRNDDNELIGAFVLARRGLASRLILETRRNRILATTLIMIVMLSLLMIYFVRRNVAQPIDGLIERIRAIGDGRWQERIRTEGKGEISSLAGEFNRMCERLQDLYGRLIKEQQERLNLERNLRQSEKLASVGQFAAGLAHEIGTPLGIIGGRAEFLLRRPRSNEEVAGNLEIIRSQIDRIAGIVRQLLEFARRREPAFRDVDLVQLLNTVTGLLEHKIVEKNVGVDIKIAPMLPCIKADPHQLQQVFINLFLNSLHALPSGGRIEIAADMMRQRSAKGEETAGAGKLRIIFEDNGAGIPAEHLGQVFDPFFTTKDIGQGTGLGLSVVYGIIKDHQGEIRVHSQPGEYTRFEILLPTDSSASVASPREMVA